ncbi:MAG: orotidine-5'-phosphate decarboxylase [Ignavibacteria bacterium]|nr:orotidine-5'-phosphate decarboxylase [Ignavibacteria bacterium]
MKYINKLEKTIIKKGSHLIVGIDPDKTKFPEFIKKKKNPLYEFCKFVINITSDFVTGYKFNVAFFEAEGYKGIETLEQLLEEKKKDFIYICDAKRGDIGNTSEQYARAYFDKMGFDAITVSPYMGVDSIEPFLKRKNKFIYVLALTSNKGSKDFQKLLSGKKHLFEIVIEKFLNSGYYNIGFVMGADYAKRIKKITSYRREIPLLIPGVGTQGGDLPQLLKNLKNEYFLINSSRKILYAGKPTDNLKIYAEKVRSECKKLNDSIKSLKK